MEDVNVPARKQQSGEAHSIAVDFKDPGQRYIYESIYIYLTFKDKRSHCPILSLASGRAGEEEADLGGF
ncbi:hypothetical protein [Thermogemmatispora sp.]|uniref:hypothetical protein n=1 Tax=Thermogemmatispora sp. TaxID=1968838 RepID=UPI0035E40F3F